MKTPIKTVLLIVNCLLLTVLSSCTEVDLEDPLKGKVSLCTDWSGCGKGIKPESYAVVIAGRTINCIKETTLLPELNAGTYPVHIYNTPEKININGTIATVTTNGNEVHASPDWLFTAVTEAVYVDFKVETITAVMQQQVRQVTIELTVTEGDPERIASTAATLTGIANNLDFKTNAHSGVNLSVSPVFTRNGNKLTAIVRLLGVASETQKLTLDITFADDSTQHIESDVSNLLAGFNTNKHIPLSISADLNTPVEAGFTATIIGWKVIGDSSGVAW